MANWRSDSILELHFLVSVAEENSKSGTKEPKVGFRLRWLEARAKEEADLRRIAQKAIGLQQRRHKKVLGLKER